MDDVKEALGRVGWEEGKGNTPTYQLLVVDTIGHYCCN